MPPAEVSADLVEVRVQDLEDAHQLLPLVLSVGVTMLQSPEAPLNDAQQEARFVVSAPLTVRR